MRKEEELMHREFTEQYNEVTAARIGTMTKDEVSV